jgi:hypothetical protein
MRARVKGSQNYKRNCIDASEAPFGGDIFVIGPGEQASMV